MQPKSHGREPQAVTTNGNVGWIANYIWGIATTCYATSTSAAISRRHPPDDGAAPAGRGPRGHQAERPRHERVLDAAGVVEQDPALRQAADQAFYNHVEVHAPRPQSRASRQRLTADFIAYLDGFSPNVQDILDNFEFRNQISRLSKADALGTLIERLTSPDINLSPNPGDEHRRIGPTRRPRQPRHGNHLRRASAPLQRGEQRRGRRALDAARRRGAHGEAALSPHRRPDQVGTYLLYDGAAALAAC